LGKPVLISQMQFVIDCNISIFKLFVIAHKLFKRRFGDLLTISDPWTNIKHLYLVPFWWWQHVVSKV